MRHEWTRCTVDGFGSGEVDFARQYARLSAEDKAAFDANVMSPIVNGVDGVFVVITGHSDRVDSGGAHKDLLRQEGLASWERADSAQKTLLSLIGKEWLTPGPSSWGDMPQVALSVSAAGAVRLLEDGGDEVMRKRNRRVEIEVCQFIPD